MQETEIDIISTDEPGMIDKIKSWAYDNWQTILVVLIVLIVGMSAYNYNQNGNIPDEKNNPAAATDNNSTNDSKNTAKTDGSDTADKTANAEASAEKSDQDDAAEEDSSVSANNTANKNTDSNTVTSTIDDSGKKFTITAEKGDGITHLARKALGEYLKETGQGSDLTPEHKIYIEDYMQNRTGSQKVLIGQQQSFSEGLITDAISSAKTLSPRSLENLQKYIK